MYIVEHISETDTTFDTIDKAETYAKLVLGRRGRGAQYAVCKVEKIIASKREDLQIAEISGDDFLKKVEQSKQACLALGIKQEDIDLY